MKSNETIGRDASGERQYKEWQFTPDQTFRNKHDGYSFNSDATGVGWIEAGLNQPTIHNLKAQTLEFVHQ